LYFAENPAVAETYKGTNPAVLWEGKTISRPEAVENLAALLKSDQPSARVAAQPHNVAQLITDWAAGGNDVAAMRRRIAQGDWTPNIKKELYAGVNAAEGKLAFDKGHMYEVNIHADPEQFLNYDIPISQQSPAVQKALAQSGIIAKPVDLGSFGGAPITGAPKYGTTIAEAQALRQAGIPGIRYLDQGSRNVNGRVSLETKYRAAGLDNSSSIMERFFAQRFKANNGDLGQTINRLETDLAHHPNDETVKRTLEFARDPSNKFTYEPPVAQTSNYVLFRDDIIDILRKYGLAGGMAGSALPYAFAPSNAELNQ
jgi:hypothetical protein